jgi:hypothetical protein
MEQPSRNGWALADDIPDGERVRNLGCGLHNGDAWCKVEYRSQQGWVRQRWLKESPESGEGGHAIASRDRPHGSGDTRDELHIESARYRVDGRHCDPAHRLAEACNGPAECRLRVGNDLSGDPARGERKSVDIVYRCNGRSHRASVREGDEATLSCP